jgi:hypothetical protein
MKMKSPELKNLTVLHYFPPVVSLAEHMVCFTVGIYFCNIGIEKIPHVLEVDPDANAAIIDRRLAGLKFLRPLTICI